MMHPTLLVFVIGSNVEEVGRPVPSLGVVFVGGCSASEAEHGVLFAEENRLLNLRWAQ